MKTMNEIDQINYDMLINFMAEKADCFSFSEFYNKRLLPKDFDIVMEEVLKYREEQLREVWSRISEDDKKYLPSFDEIQNEYEKKSLEKYKRNKSLAVAMRKLNWKEMSAEERKEYLNKHQPTFLSTDFYFSPYRDVRALGYFVGCYDFYIDQKINDEVLMEEEKEEYSENYGAAELDIPHDYLQKVELTHFTHCTISGNLYRVFYFAMNEDMKNWLLSKKSLSSLPLKDIAFYKNGDRLFGVCTHEDYYTIPKGKYHGAISSFKITR
ncbi:MAG: hypothetical protein FWE62_02780 [Firmicutes bacterium]|nr:hypothetical protein [Bacillota bacterium]